MHNMECYDPSTNVYFRLHQEYVGHDPQRRGRCVRCGEIIDGRVSAEEARAAIVQQSRDRTAEVRRQSGGSSYFG
jgi:hypothetical protein